jgi:glycosyltransferase involved in cell wall biosynthesis
MTDKKRILLLEPFYGGSHKDVADGLKTHSRHHIELLTLPDRFWKWRLRGAALYWAGRIQSPDAYDALLSSSLVSLADLKALWAERCPPAAVYFHENQLSYPLAPGERMDYQYGFTNISTALAAQRLLFNSHYHLQAFIGALPGFLRMMPDCRPNWITAAIAEKTAVVYPGCHFAPEPRPPSARRPGTPLIIWNHRWEHDKNPEAFFQALKAVRQRGIEFELALLGETFGNKPTVFDTAFRQLGDCIVQFGRVPSRDEYYQWLRRGTVVVSTALQENFGIAVVEAMAHGCLPLLPARLSYPEILPQSLHADFLYGTQEDLESRLAYLLTHWADFESQRRELAAAMSVHAWPSAVEAFDRELDRLVRQANGPDFSVQG